jgi:hypothetical protein
VEAIRGEIDQALWHTTSALPASYAAMMGECYGYTMKAGAKMLMPVATPDLIELASAMLGIFPYSSEGFASFGDWDWRR